MTRDAYDFAPGERQLSVFEYEESHDFGGRDMREAIAEEFMQKEPSVILLERIPPLLKVDDAFQTFPVQLELRAEAPAEAH